MHLANALHQQLGGGLLEDDARAAEFHGLHEFVLVLGGGQHDDPGALACQLQALQDAEAVQTGHPQVEQQDVRLQLVEQAEYLGAVVGLADDLEILLQTQQLAQAVAENGVIVRDYDADPLLLRLGVGTHVSHVGSRFHGSLLLGVSLDSRANTSTQSIGRAIKKIY
jgi:hypothetical protein